MNMSRLTRGLAGRESTWLVGHLPPLRTTGLPGFQLQASWDGAWARPFGCQNHGPPPSQTRSKATWRAAAQHVWIATHV
jgi:hypothetical protein